MKLRDLKKNLWDALATITEGDPIPGDRVDAWAAAIQEIDGDPGRDSWQFSARTLRDAKGRAKQLRTEITLVLAKLERWKPPDPRTPGT